jgi:hypothetical protein
VSGLCISVFHNVAVARTWILLHKELRNMFLIGDFACVGRLAVQCLWLESWHVLADLPILGELSPHFHTASYVTPLRELSSATLLLHLASYPSLPLLPLPRASTPLFPLLWHCLLLALGSGFRPRAPHRLLLFRPLKRCTQVWPCD